MQARCPKCSEVVEAPAGWEGGIFACPRCGADVSLLDSVESLPFEAGSSPAMPADERLNAARSESGRKAGKKHMTQGLAWFGGGAAVTFLTFILTTGGATTFYVIAWGAMLVGFIQFVWGLKLHLGSRERPVSSERALTGPLLFVVLLVCFVLAAVSVLPFTEPEKQGLADWLLLGGLNLLPVGWAALVLWRTSRQERWLNTSRGAWLIGMAIAYALGAGAGVYVFVFAFS
jgi:hypothetical protein